MATLVHTYDWPDRFIVGTVGRPGDRTFYLQVRHGSEVVSVALEKQQSQALADRIDEILDELMADVDNPHTIPARAPEGLEDRDPLDMPVEEQFRVGVIGLGWNPGTAQIVIEAYALTETDGEETPDVMGPPSDPEEALVVSIPVGSARAFAQRTREVVSAGRPQCPLCFQPVDDAGHECSVPDDLV